MNPQRRLTVAESQRGLANGWTAVLDLALEFTESSPLREAPRYRSAHLLDRTAPTDAELCELVGWIQQAVVDGGVYVHCALGHGRSATVVLAYLMATGSRDGCDQGLAYLQSLRKGVRLCRAQREVVERIISAQRGVDVSRGDSAGSDEAKPLSGSQH